MEVWKPRGFLGKAWFDIRVWASKFVPFRSGLMGTFSAESIISISSFARFHPSALFASSSQLRGGRSVSVFFSPWWVWLFPYLPSSCWACCQSASSISRFGMGDQRESCFHPLLGFDHPFVLVFQLFALLTYLIVVNIESLQDGLLLLDAFMFAKFE